MVIIAPVIIRIRLTKKRSLCLATTFSRSYRALQLGFNGATIDIAKSNLTAIRFSIYGDPATTKAGDRGRIVINAPCLFYIDDEGFI